MTFQSFDNDAFDLEPTMGRIAYAVSIASEGHPDRNEDNLVVDKINDVYGVFDGLGGYAGGEIASQAAADFVKQQAGSVPDIESPADVALFLKQLLKDTNESVLDATDVAATTAVVTKIHQFEGQTYVSIAHVGDSRAYIFRDGELKMLTVDHTPYRIPGRTHEAMAQQERLGNVVDVVDINTLSHNSIVAFNRRNIIGACLGHDTEVKMDVKHFAVETGDVIILTSDGVHDNLATSEMQGLLLDASSASYADHLTRAARERARQTRTHLRAKQDDITAVVIEI